jgi:hypothetical protein
MGNAHSKRKSDCIKLKASLLVAVQRLRLLQKRKEEQAIKERVLVADYLKSKFSDDFLVRTSNLPLIIKLRF